ncbi:short-chain dehydrogenase/reductase family 16C member 6-like [Microplitis mediator]|uniref:short-chain dehydrogenase/reductase family 16C member 6-like n=1 Tax=Microplitis mediator TaxID=375433 RepID=UPI0025570B2B|nr:short-chain dehydrogenase/reductase family 16C member 6-like [Microplitis mediator]XP_057330327.1 short-chain dehydrogenase/reductase family 16C member 6-like [Microplitis mediator]XP_057330328.1 short-chain dehydrogenase/reductase family 16C member 6-like [Microplitis mediator]
MVTAYEAISIAADLCLLLIKVFYYTIESTYRLIVPIEEKSVAGEIVLITGAGHGIGRELAYKYASLGAIVVCWDLNAQSNQETVNEIMKLGATTAYAYQCDVSDREEVVKVSNRVKSEVGHPTILINNAGIMPCQKFLDYSPETIKKIMDINVLAHFWILQEFLPIMIKNNYGHVVALCSIAGMVGLKNLVPYCASKFAVRGLMESLNDELSSAENIQKNNIKFTTIYPYMVDTGLCKKPHMRFPSLMSLVPPRDAAAVILTAQRRNYRDATIPRYWNSVNCVLRVFPEKAVIAIKDFLNSGVEADS